MFKGIHALVLNGLQTRPCDTRPVCMAWDSRLNRETPLPEEARLRERKTEDARLDGKDKNANEIWRPSLGRSCAFSLPIAAGASLEALDTFWRALCARPWERRTRQRWDGHSVVSWKRLCYTVSEYVYCRYHLLPTVTQCLRFWVCHENLGNRPRWCETLRTRSEYIQIWH
jgi:hypothetical protein